MNPYEPPPHGRGSPTMNAWIPEMSQEGSCKAADSSNDTVLLLLLRLSAVVLSMLPCTWSFWSFIGLRSSIFAHLCGYFRQESISFNCDLLFAISPQVRIWMLWSILPARLILLLKGLGSACIQSFKDITKSYKDCAHTYMCIDYICKFIYTYTS